MATRRSDRDAAKLKRIFDSLAKRYAGAQKHQPLSEREFVETAISFADAPNSWNAWISLLHGVRLTSTPEPSAPTPFEPERKLFCSYLSEIASDGVLSNPTEIALAAERVLLIPRANLDGRDVRLSYWHLPEDLWPALAYAVLLLADKTKGIGSELRQCQLEKCQKFFFVQRPKTGRPRSTYCSDDHMQEAHKATAAKRVRESRARRRKKRTKR